MIIIQTTYFYWKTISQRGPTTQVFSEANQGGWNIVSNPHIYCFLHLTCDEEVMLKRREVTKWWFGEEKQNICFYNLIHKVLFIFQKQNVLLSAPKLLYVYWH